MPSYLVHLRRTDKESSSASHSAHEALTRINEAASKSWTVGSIMRDDVAIDEDTLRSDAANEIAAYRIESTDHWMLTVSLVSNGPSCSR